MGWSPRWSSANSLSGTTCPRWAGPCRDRDAGRGRDPPQRPSSSGRRESSWPSCSARSSSPRRSVRASSGSPRKGPTGLGVILHYAVLGALIARRPLVPRAGRRPTRSRQRSATSISLREAAQQLTGIKHDILVAIDRKLSDLPSGSRVIDPAVEYGRKAFEVILGTSSCSRPPPYWILERERAVDFVCSRIAETEAEDRPG